MRQRARLTITLPEELIKRIDLLIDGINVRNRSHAVERLLEKSLEPELKTAVILAGGKASRLKSPLKKIGNQYLLSLMFDQLKQYGLTRIVICTTDELADELITRFGDGQTLGLELIYSREPEPLGTAGALKFAQDKLPSVPFLVVHGDVLTDMNITEFIEFHHRQTSWATIGVKPRLSERSFGRVFLQGNKITQFLSTGSDQGISIVNTGLYILDPKILNLIKPNQKVFLETDIFPKLSKKGLLNAFLFQGLWYDISSKESLTEAITAWSNKK